MESTPKLVVHFGKKANAVAAKFIPIMIVAMSVLLIFIRQEPQSLSHLPWFTTIMRWFLITGITFFVGMGFLMLIMTRNKKPLAVLDHSGLWMRYYNLVPWENIEEISVYKLPGAPLQAIGIRVKDVNEAARNSNASGRFGLWCVKTLGQRYHMNLTNMDGAQEEITLFVHRHILPLYPTIACNLTIACTDESENDTNNITNAPSDNESFSPAPAKKPNIFTRTDYFLTPFMLLFIYFFNHSKTIARTGFSSDLGAISSFILAALLGIILRQFWGPMARQFKEKKLVPLSEVLLCGTVVAGVFIADKLMTGTFYYSLIINLIVGIIAWAELIRRHYWTR